MSTIRSRPLGAPIDRKYLDTARGPMRVFFGVIFVAYCAISTVIGVRDDLAPLAWSADLVLDLVPAGLLIGLALAVGIFIGEVLLAERSLGWYLPLLLVDAWYTARWSGWIGDLIHAHMQANALVEDGLSFVVTWAAAIAIAYLGERLIFDKRRRASHE